MVVDRDLAYCIHGCIGDFVCYYSAVKAMDPIKLKQTKVRIYIRFTCFQLYRTLCWQTPKLIILFIAGTANSTSLYMNVH